MFKITKKNHCDGDVFEYSFRLLHYYLDILFQEAVKALLDCGADIDIKTTAEKNNVTPLCYAAQKGHYDILKFLLERGASPDLKSKLCC